MTSTIIFDFFGLKISIKVDSSYIFKSLQHLYVRQLAISRNIPPEKVSARVNS